MSITVDISMPADGEKRSKQKLKLNVSICICIVVLTGVITTRVLLEFGVKNQLLPIKSTCKL